MTFEEFRKRLAEKKKEFQKRPNNYSIEKDGIHTRRL